jgi:hypothetical protein
MLVKGGLKMATKRHKPEEIVTKLRQVDVLVGQGMVRVDAIRQVSIKALAHRHFRNHSPSVFENRRACRAIENSHHDRIAYRLSTPEHVCLAGHTD